MVIKNDKRIHIDTNNKIWFNQKSIVRKYRILDLPNILELKIKGLKPRRIAVVIVSLRGLEAALYLFSLINLPSVISNNM